MVESREYYLRLALLGFGLIVAYLSVTQSFAEPDIFVGDAAGRRLETSLAMFIVPINTALAIHDRIAINRRIFLREESRNADRLTGLLTRDSFFASLERQRFDTEVYDDYFFLILDIDGYRSICDEHGSRAGDAVISHVANSMRCFAGPDMTLGRLTESALIISGLSTSVSSIHEYGQRLIEYVEADDRYYAGLIIRVTACIGVCRSDHEGAVANVVSQARDMMRQARLTGTHKMILYS